MILGLYGNNGKENGSSYSAIGVILGLYVVECPSVRMAPTSFKTDLADL